MAISSANRRTRRRRKTVASRLHWPYGRYPMKSIVAIRGRPLQLTMFKEPSIFYQFELQICKPSTMSKPPESLSDRIRAIIQIWRNGSGGQQVAKHRQQVGKRIISTASGPLAILHWKVVAVETSESGTKTLSRTFESRNFGRKV